MSDRLCRVGPRKSSRQLIHADLGCWVEPVTSWPSKHPEACSKQQKEERGHSVEAKPDSSLAMTNGLVDSEHLKHKYAKTTGSVSATTGDPKVQTAKKHT
mmetsp:Transcript_13303/g.20184  ORF Transcript_13303/g.20184 Transcript_13303/m.20184 type:complete len:100 (+) Transcript_13303:64-363(+)